MAGDQYNTEQAMAVGPNAYAHADQVQFIKFSGEGSMDPAKLAAELASLRQAVRNDPTASQDEKDEAVGALLEAEKSAKKGDEGGTRGALSRAGTWVLGVAKDIGVGLAVVALQAALGM
jgi:hypothetical protein